MFSQPEHYHNLSQRLSQVLEDIGVNKTIIMKRRRTWMLTEAIEKIRNHLIPEYRLISSYYFGSQTEGSTTQGLHSDIDIVLCDQSIRILQDWSEWEYLPDKLQYVMVQDETTSPGYCLLQLLRPDAPLPAQDVPNEYHTTDDRGRVLFSHSIYLQYIHGGSDGVRHGPAHAVHREGNRIDSDHVTAFHCSSWPKEAEPWLHQQNKSGWPSEKMKRYSAEQGCFVVPVGSRTGVNQDLDWRISTSLAERCLMFNLNITQMMCYILMKMILKNFLKPRCGEAISSFMCKNILFRCIAESENCSLWNEGSLLTWLNKCLQLLFHCILTDHCTHFIIPSNNLLAGKLSEEVKHKLVNVMCSLTENIEQSLLGIKTDDLGNRLHVKSGGIVHVNLKNAHDISVEIGLTNNHDVAAWLLGSITHFQQCYLSKISSDYHLLTDSVFRLCQIYQVGNTLERVATTLHTPFLCSHIGSIMASQDIQLSQDVSPLTMRLLSMGLNSDISSGKLKLASVLYSVRDLDRCEIMLATLRRQLSQTPVLTLSSCNKRIPTVSEELKIACFEKNEEMIKQNMAFCVIYLPCEVNCVPNELRYEMFRSTAKDRPYRGKGDFWMDWAVVDSVPYLYFLQYRVYKHLHRPAEQLHALNQLIWTINTGPNLSHKETALNLLGQCMEHENRMNAALRCYMISLNVRGINNAAKWHVCRLLARMFKCRSD